MTTTQHNTTYRIINADCIEGMRTMPDESVTDRCTKSHEYIFLLTKSANYWYDAEAVSEPATCDRMRGPALHSDTVSTNGNCGLARREFTGIRNRRSVWTVATKPYKGAHFATYPPELIEQCVLAGCPIGGTVFDPFTGSGTTAEVAMKYGRNFVGTEINPEYIALAEKRLSSVYPMFTKSV